MTVSIHGWTLVVASLALFSCERGTPRNHEEPTVQMTPNGVQVRQTNEPTVQVNQGAGTPHGAGTVVQTEAPGEPTVAVQNTPSQGTQLNVGGLQIAVPTLPGQNTQTPQPGGSHPPIVCDSTQSVVLSHINISAGAQPAVMASGNCQVQLSDSTLASMAVAVHASGSAQVNLIRCTVTGAAGALDASGNAQIHYTGSTLQGTVHHSGTATISGT